MRNIRNKRVVKKTVGDLKKELKDIPDDTEVILAFYYISDDVVRRNRKNEKPDPNIFKKPAKYHGKKCYGDNKGKSPIGSVRHLIVRNGLQILHDMMK